MNTSAITTTTSSTLQQAPAVDFEAVANAVLLDVAESSARVYAQTFRAWAAWCQREAIAPIMMTPDNVRAFLASGDTTATTRARQLSALRKLIDKLQTMVLLTSPQDAPLFDVWRRLLKDMRAPKPEADSGSERTHKALTPAEADRVLRAWNGTAPIERRNAALVALLLTTGIRRAEAAALQWRDIDFENGVITIRHGKGDKARQAAVAGNVALDALRAWQMEQPAGRVYVFCSITKGGKLRADAPITGTDVYRIIEATGQRAGVDFKPHDARRTFITEALDMGVAISEVQAQAGHARGDTTLRYAQAVNARERRRKLKLRYG